MTDKKFTDEEIKKALECCIPQCHATCEECPLFEHKMTATTTGVWCDTIMLRNALDLINRYEAEIEKLTSGATVKAVGGIAELIEKQQAEIKRLHSEVEEKTETIVFLKDQAVGWSIDFCNLKAKLDAAKSKAIKEFAERLTHTLVINNEENTDYFDFAYTLETIDTLVKGMTEGQQ